LTTLEEAIQAARVAATGRPREGHARDLVLDILHAAEQDPRVSENLKGIPKGRALLRFTDSDEAIEFAAGEGTIHAEPAETKGKGPKVDATGATWLGLVSGTLKPWLAFTRGMVVARAGLSELRWLQQVAERLQKAYAEEHKT
jgi:hypothetical protein